MIRFATQRIASVVATLFGMAVAIFLLVRLLPGNAVAAMLGPGEPADPAEVARLTHALGLDKPWPVQFGEWIGGLLTGHLGKSYLNDQSIGLIVVRGLPITLEIAIGATVVGTVFGVTLGVVAAVWQNGFWDGVIRIAGMAGLALPSFWIATLMLLLTSTAFHWVPPVSYVSPFKDPLGNLAQFALPVLAVSLHSIASLMRLTRTSMLEVLHDDYLRTARSKGCSKRRSVVRHALRNALLPVITVIGYNVGHLLGGVPLIETIFGLPGVGYTLIQAINSRDYGVIQTMTVLLAAVFIAVNLLIDLMYGVLDPRVREAA